MTIKEKYQFTDVQMRKIFEYLERIDAIKNDMMSNSEITDFRMFTNAQSEFVCTFLETEAGMSGMSLQNRIVLINTSGDVVNLSDYLGNETAAKEYVSHMTQIKF